jgi:hypothetical protein
VKFHHVAVHMHRMDKISSDRVNSSELIRHEFQTLWMRSSPRQEACIVVIRLFRGWRISLS